MRRAAGYLVVLIAVVPSLGHAQGTAGERNAVLVLVDGLRWQEVFRGADEALLNKEAGGIPDPAAARKEFWRDRAEDRRAALLPFVWGTIAREGQLWGNRDKGSAVRVSNEHWFSYPGYSEMVVGFADPRIDSNEKKPNPNVTVLEWLGRRPGFEGRVAAFGMWDTLPFILNRERCGFPVNAGTEPMTGVSTPRMELLNQLKADIPPAWSGTCFDAITLHTALEYMRERRPRVVLITFGETDEFGHAGRYDRYLDAARRTDGFLRTIWETVQSLPDYRGRTTLIVTADHGRGNPPEEWKSHGRQIAGSDAVWLAAIGPAVRPLGERSNVPTVTLAQTAATLAAAVGEDYASAVPRAARAVGDLLAGRPAGD